MSHVRHTANGQSLPRLVKKIFFTLFLFTALGELNVIYAQTTTLPDAQESHPGIGLESRYAEAVIAYNRKQMKTAVTILDELIAINPKNVEYLELKALALKGGGAPGKSFEVYKRLYEISPEPKRGPYAFELGTLLDKDAKTDAARPYFEKSIELNFNVAASHLYLGLGHYKNANYAEAERSFTVVANSGIPDLEIVGRYYLGICYFKLNNGAQGIQEFVDVQKMARRRQNDPLSKNIADATNKMLDPFSQGQWFGNAALMTQYDSNVQQLPAGSTNQTATVNPASLKMNFSGGGGYMSAPLSDFQVVAGYRASYNYNFNDTTKSFEYFTNSASLFLNYQTLARTSGGLKVEGNFTFQNSLVDPTVLTSGYAFQKYNATIGVGPYFRHQLDRSWRFEAEMGIRTQTFYIDPNLSGMNYNARVSFRKDAAHPAINPGISLIYEKNATTGSQFFYNAYGIGLTNSMNLGRGLSLFQSIDFLYSNYSTSSPSRTDQNYTFKIAGVKTLGPKWSLLADIGYILNHSTVAASYEYNRFLTSFGVGYTL